MGKNKRSNGDHRVGKKGKRDEGRHYTVSMGISGSIINNAQSLEIATRLAGQIARAATIFRIDEIVVFDDGESSESLFNRTGWGRESGEKSGGEFLARILRYLEVPQYLRRALIPMHKSLRFAGQLPPLDAPHHLRKQAWLPYREGVVLKKAVEGVGSYVDVGLDQDVVIEQRIEAGKRITVQMRKPSEHGIKLNAVESSVPREKAGLYWGYSVRHVDGVTNILSGCPYEDSYDYVIGTSEHGERISTSDLSLPAFRHLMVVFGGPAGLEESMELDGREKGKKVQQLFHKYLNTCPNQGSRTIRSEEAILISLQYLQLPLSRAILQSESA